MVSAAAKQILIVDDEPDILESMASLIEGRIPDVLVQTACDAAEALAWLEDNEADVIVSDFRMPGLNGLQFLEEVRRRHGPQNAILLTAYDERRGAVDAARLSIIRRFFMKPPDVAELVSGIEELLSPERLSAKA